MENDNKYHLVPPESDSAPIVGGFISPNDRGKGNENRPKDIFGYAKFGERLADIVCEMRTPLVVALTGAWGSGKSVFIKQWAGKLQNRWAKVEKNEMGEKEARKPEDAPVIYFDAFANDHQESALFALAGEVMEFIGKHRDGKGEIKKSATRIAKGVGSVLAEGTARCATAGMVGVSDIAEAMQSALEKRMENAKQGRDAFQEFRDALEEAAKKIGGGQPLVFIVDELDRCRPDFALELLEKIKHLFSVPNVCFLVVTNLEQFKAVVQRTYGYGENEARVYLDKFFHHVFQLPKAQTGKERLYVEYLLQSSHVSFPFYDSEHVVRGMLTEMAIVHRLELRDIERILTVVALVGASTEDEFFQEVGPAFVVGLCVMRRIKPELFKNAADGTLSWERAEEFLQFSKWAGWINNPARHRRSWAAAVKQNSELTPDEKVFERLGSYFAPLPRLIEELDPPRRI